MARNKKQKVFFYGSGALTVGQTVFVRDNRATVLTAYDPESADSKDRHVFARAEVQGFEQCAEAELFAADAVSVDTSSVSPDPVEAEAPEDADSDGED